jgi:hypothetical protein
MRTFATLFMAGSYWVIFRDEHDEGWTFQHGTHSIHKEDVNAVVEGLNLREKTRA